MKAEPDVGILSAAEETFVEKQKHYEEVLAIAKYTARELAHALAEGVPKLDLSNAAARDAQRRTFQLINTFAWANARLTCAADRLQPEISGELEREVIL